MAIPTKRNAFYAQSGGVTAVINASAAGIIETARTHRNRIVHRPWRLTERPARTLLGAYRESQVGRLEPPAVETDDRRR